MRVRVITLHFCNPTSYYCKRRFYSILFKGLKMHDISYGITIMGGLVIYMIVFYCKNQKMGRRS